MTNYAKLPLELLEEIFKHLGSGDLWKCLGICRQWRFAANSDKLWKIHCSKVGIDEIPLSTPEGTEDLCIWAAAYYIHYLCPIKNWKSKSYKTYYISVLDESFIESWEGNRGVIYYFKIDKLMAYEIHSQGIITSDLPCFFNTLPKEEFSMSVRINKDCLAISNYNLVFVYKKKEDTQAFEPFKMIHTYSDILKIMDYNENSLKNKFSFESTLQIKAILPGVLWISDNYGDKYFVVNILNDIVKELPIRSYFTTSTHSSLVATWDVDVNLHNRYGDIIFRLDIKCWDLCFNSEIIAIGNSQTQTVETWNIRSGHKLMSRSVLLHTDIVIHHARNIVVIAEKSRDVYRFTCIDAITGTITWRIHPPPQQARCHLVKPISEYIFVLHSHLNRPKYTLMTLSDGKLIHDGLLPMNKTHVTTSLWVFNEYDNFKIMSFIG